MPTARCGQGDHPKTPAAFWILHRCLEERNSVVAYRGEGPLMKPHNHSRHRSIDVDIVSAEPANHQDRRKTPSQDGKDRSAVGADSDRAVSESGNGEPEYRIGFCRPPLHSRIRPGEVRNPKGRPRGSKNRPRPVEARVIEAALIRHERDMLRLHEAEMRRLARRIERKIERLDLQETEREFPGIRIEGAIGPDQFKEIKRLKEEEERLLIEREDMVAALEEVRGTPDEVQYWPEIGHIDRLLVRNREAQARFKRKL